MNHILVAVDGSDCAKRALETAISFAQKFNAKVTTINVFMPPYLPPEPYVSVSATLEESVRKYGEQVAQEAAKFAESQGVKAEWICATGAPAELIVDTALAQGCDLVVVGSRGRGAVRRALLGSVSSRLAHICTVPLLIVH
jgi:nucleotide-binding universal stress UspA family protein